MSDRNNNDLAALLTPAPSKGVQFSQGVILSWDNQFGTNQIEWRGITLTDIPFVEGVNPLTLKVGDVVGMLGWAPENAKGVGSWWILGKITNPGEFVSDLTFFLGQIRFMTMADRTVTQAYFGSDTGGNPFTVLYYGDAADTRALFISGRNRLSINDASGHEVFGTDGASLNGLSRPYLYYHLAPTTSAAIVGTVFVPTTQSATYVDLYEGNPHVWHPRVSYDIGISATGVTDWRIVVNGTVVFTGSPSASGAFDIPGWGSTVVPSSIVNFVIQARNTGAGLTRVMIRRFEGVQS